MKKWKVHIVGILLLSSLPMYGSTPIRKKRSFNCQSDNKVSQTAKKRKQSMPEYSASVVDKNGDGKNVDFIAKKNVIIDGSIRTLLLTRESAQVENTGKYLVIQGTEWALAIAPEKKRASLYNMNPDLNEVPMFCLSQ